MQLSDPALHPSVFRRIIRLMGNRFEFTILDNDESSANECLRIAIEEVQRIERLLTTFKEDSQTNLINRFAGIEPVKVDPEVFRLISRSIRISELTQGAFDISYGSIDKSLWNFDTAMPSLPDPQTARKLVRLINYRNIILDESASTIFLKNKGMRIGFGGIGKGYAADCAKKVLQEAGINHGVVNAAGDLVVWGTQPNGKKWTAGIADPNNKNEIFSSVELDDLAIATSGDYEKYAIINGNRYSHTIDPKTGLPVRGIKSVTVIAPSAELADALTTPVMVMGRKAGLNLINQLPKVECIIVTDNNQVFTSKNISVQ